MSLPVAKTKSKNDAKDRFIIRFHDEHHREQFKLRAAKNHRTMNAEILCLLEAGLRAMSPSSEKTHE
ncbi:Arc family DNA-binding protein [Massilia violaceinigra]|nr:Arc family DNA-binding protein [Massilia violaceinigra]